MYTECALEYMHISVPTVNIWVKSTKKMFCTMKTNLIIIDNNR